MTLKKRSKKNVKSVSKKVEPVKKVTFSVDTKTNDGIREQSITEQTKPKVKPPEQTKPKVNTTEQQTKPKVNTTEQTQTKPKVNTTSTEQTKPKVNTTSTEQTKPKPHSPNKKTRAEQKTNPTHLPIQKVTNMTKTEVKKVKNKSPKKKIDMLHDKFKYDVKSSDKHRYQALDNAIILYGLNDLLSKLQENFENKKLVTYQQDYNWLKQRYT